METQYVVMVIKDKGITKTQYIHRKAKKKKKKFANEKKVQSGVVCYPNE